MGIPKAYPENPCTLVLGSVKIRLETDILEIEGLSPSARTGEKWQIEQFLELLNK